ncbi:hypothetical protein GGX14DRAFT_388442 [Mycena pura]|uniref:Uncharacterized protein n=1 Tax=Mycena pura TaxID=153505 RepID=A0AAD6VS43_9AGAR|nr:hypothetical protein GGX14DRAFT_388442 [Mycena pura]
MNTCKQPCPSKVRTPRAASTILTRRRACALYREKQVRNLETLNEKARERMALRREKMKTDAALHEEALQRAREASCRYRKQKARELAFKQRERRDIEYIKKYGEEALANRNRTRQERRESARAAVELRTWEKAWRDEREKSAAGRRAQRDAAETLTSQWVDPRGFNIWDVSGKPAGWVRVWSIGNRNPRVYPYPHTFLSELELAVPNMENTSNYHFKRGRQKTTKGDRKLRIAHVQRPGLVVPVYAVADTQGEKDRYEELQVHSHVNDMIHNGKILGLNVDNGTFSVVEFGIRPTMPRWMLYSNSRAGCCVVVAAEFPMRARLNKTDAEAVPELEVWDITVLAVDGGQVEDVLFQHSAGSGSSKCGHGGV